MGQAARSLHASVLQMHLRLGEIYQFLSRFTNEALKAKGLDLYLIEKQEEYFWHGYRFVSD